MRGIIRIAYLTKDMDVNGISTVILNYCQNIDRSRYCITIIAGPPIPMVYKEKLDALGIDIVEVPNKITDSRGYYQALFKELSRRKYDIVHVHGNSTTITIELMIAWLKGIRVRIAHCHNSTCDHLRAHKLLRPLFDLMYTHGFACSELAGKWMFGDKKFRVIPNGFDTKRFHFDASVRDDVRKELGIKEALLLGHIGRFNNQKNHPFLLDVFEAVARERDDAWLVLVGGGPDFEKVNELIQQHPYNKRIIVYGETDYPERIYNAMDVFVFPSKHEGLGIVLLEAQINGLRCIASDVVPDEASLGDSLKLLPLEESIENWKNMILEQHYEDRDQLYRNHMNHIMQYNIYENAQDMQSLYSASVVK